MVAEQLEVVHEKYRKEKEEMEGYLQSKIDKNLKLELLLDEIKDAYRSLESTMSTGDKTFKQKFEQLESTIDQITVMYQTAVNNNNVLKTDLNLEKRKNMKSEERIKMLHKKLEKGKQKNTALEQILQTVRDEYRQLTEEHQKDAQRGITRGTLGGGRIAIKGGGGKRTTPKPLKGKEGSLSHRHTMVQQKS